MADEIQVRRASGTDLLNVIAITLLAAAFVLEMILMTEGGAMHLYVNGVMGKAASGVFILIGAGVGASVVSNCVIEHNGLPENKTIAIYLGAGVMFLLPMHEMIMGNKNNGPDTIAGIVTVNNASNQLSKEQQLHPDNAALTRFVQFPTLEHLEQARKTISTGVLDKEKADTLLLAIDLMQWKDVLQAERQIDRGLVLSEDAERWREYARKHTPGPGATLLEQRAWLVLAGIETNLKAAGDTQ